MELLDFLSKIEDLCKQKNIKRQNVYIKSGIGKDFGVSIRNGSEPSISKVFALATELDCSIDYLLGRTENPLAHKSANIVFGDLSNNSGIVGNVGSTINGIAPPSENAATMMEIFNNLDTMSQAELLVYANQFKGRTT